MRFYYSTTFFIMKVSKNFFFLPFLWKFSTRRPHESIRDSGSGRDGRLWQARVEDILHSLLLQDAAVFPLGQFFSLKYHQGGESRVEEWAARARGRDLSHYRRRKKSQKQKEKKETTESLSFHLCLYFTLLFPPFFAICFIVFCRFKL